MRDITLLHPTLQTKISELMELCKNENISIGISETLRTVAEQNELYAKGRTTPGKIVTNAKGSSYNSQHQWGIAADFYLKTDVDGDGSVSDDAFNNSKKYFNKVGALAKSIGLGWGGDWSSPVDIPHLYMPDWGNTPKKLKQQYGTPEKFIATWKNQIAKTEAASADKVANKVTLTIDGYWGPATIKRLQQIFGTTQDGVISNQYSSEKTRNPGLAAATGWEWKTKPSGNSALIKAIQKKVGATQDGHIGKNTIKAMQKWLGTTQDGVISKPSSMVKALQRWCNQQ